MFVDAPVVELQQLLENITVLFVINSQSKIEHHTLDSHGEDIGLNQELGEDEQEDLAEGEGCVGGDDRIVTPL